MTDQETALGPVDYLIVEWPAGTQPNGEGLKELANLTDLGLIRVLDLVFVTKGEDGSLLHLVLDLVRERPRERAGADDRVDGGEARHGQRA